MLSSDGASPQSPSTIRARFLQASATRIRGAPQSARDDARLYGSACRCLGKAQDPLGIKPQLATFVIGNKRLYQSGFFSKFNLREAAFPTDTSQPLAGCFRAGWKRGKRQLGSPRHDDRQCAMKNVDGGLHIRYATVFSDQVPATKRQERTGAYCEFQS